MIDDIIDSLKILIMIIAIGVLAYIVSIVSDLLTAVNIFDGFFVFLITILLFFVWALAIILKLKEVS